ncbi:MAG: hypothetical protein QOE43_1454 [Gaiellaceae bacterium]|jgi:hypothetical protein|nr:hypothetical protein [Gaiellaceae bacterium]
MTFLTPLGAFVALLALLPLVIALATRRRTGSVRRALRLPPPESRAELLAPSLAAGAIVLLGLAAAQPALTRTSSPRVRRDVQALFVLDTSRSMAASSSATAPTRLDRAADAAVRLRAAVPEVESGVLTLTDRVLPDLLPVADVQGFDGVVQRAVRIESPPPRASAVRATNYGALADIAKGNDFGPQATRRIIVLLTDGESNPVQMGDLVSRLPAGRGYRFVVIRFWHANESVYDAESKAEGGYRPDPSGRTTVRDLALALGGRSFEEGQAGSAAAYLRGLAGTGPSVRVAGTERSRLALAPYLALPALFALLAALGISTFAPAGIRLRSQ